jgi:hypothetical protein
MPQWEYRKINLNDVPRKTDDVDLLNDVGEQGWEMFGVTANNVAYLKRPMPAPPLAPKARSKAATSTGDRK